MGKLDFPSGIGIFSQFDDMAHMVQNDNPFFSGYFKNLQFQFVRTHVDRCNDPVCHNRFPPLLCFKSQQIIDKLLGRPSRQSSVT